MSKVTECPSCDGDGLIMLLGSTECVWKKCVTCSGLGQLLIKNPIESITPVKFSGNSPFPLAKD